MRRFSPRHEKMKKFQTEKKPSHSGKTSGDKLPNMKELRHG